MVNSGDQSKEKQGSKKEEQTKKGRIIEVKKVAEKWKIWDEEEEAKKLVSEQFHR